MNVKLSINNYRCFSIPARFFVRDGLTALVGVNNSGKSSLLKLFYEFRNMFDQLVSPNQMADVLEGKQRNLNHPNSVFDYEEMFCNQNTRNIEVQFEFDVRRFESQDTVPIKVAITLEHNESTWAAKLFVGGDEYNSKTGGKINVSSDDNRLILGAHKFVLSDFTEIFQSLHNTLYVGAYRNIIDVGPTQQSLSENNYYDIQIGRVFVHKWEILKTGRNKKQNNLTQKVTEDIKEIFGFKTLEINSSIDGISLQVIINSKSYMLTELGSGLAQFIVVLANAAIVKPAFILIDEPELNLHPTLQYDFLIKLASYARNGIIYATHSLGLAQGYADWVYSVHRNEDETSTVTDYAATPRLPEFLGALSYTGYRELGYKKILLVEGPTEVKAIQQLLRLYKLSHKVVLLHMGGDNTFLNASDIELQEIKRISDEVYALIDSEKNSAKAALSNGRQDFIDRCKANKIHYHVLERRALEHYFTERAIRQGAGHQYRQLTPYEDFNALPSHLKWSKKKNWRIANAVTLAELDSTDLGKFLKGLGKTNKVKKSSTKPSVKSPKAKKATKASKK